MKILFLLLFPAFAWAYTGQLIYQPKDATHAIGSVLYKPTNFKPNGAVIEVLPGLGEIGTGSLNDLRKPALWPIFQTLFQAADVFGFSVVIVQTCCSFQYGEIQYGYQQAITTLQGDPNNISLLAHSNGGYGLNKEVAKNPAIALVYSTITITSSGPGVVDGSAKNLAGARAVWLLTSAIDSLSGTTYHVTDALYTDILNAGGKVWETKYNIQTHNGVLSGILSAFGIAPFNWLPVSSANAIGFTTVRMSWYQWVLANHLGSPVVTPSDFIAVTKPPVITLPIILHDTVKIQVSIPVPYPVHDTIRYAVHDTLVVPPPVILKGVYRVFSDGSIKTDSSSIK